jgi:hypothetical protein
MTLRENYNSAKRHAAMLLDLVRNGNKKIDLERINWALCVLGEPLE